MRNRLSDRKKGSRKGSIILIVTGILFCLFLFAFSYSRFLSQQAAMSDKLSKKQKFSSIASALATITSHKLQFSAQTMNNPSSRRAYPEGSPYLKAVFDYLSLPISNFSETKIFPLPLDEDATPHFSMVLDPLWQGAGYGEELQENISLVINKSDFISTGAAQSAYGREKNGFIDIHIVLDVKNGERLISSVDFDFSCPVRVATVHAPVLSKFNLYIEDAKISSSEHEFAYNQVSVDELGNFASARSKAVPLVLNNDDNLHLQVQQNLRNFIEDQRGLVYLGGSSNYYLNLARSDVVAPESDSGEGFQFFRKNNFDGTYPVKAVNHPDGRKILLSKMNLGVSDDPGNRSSSFYAVIECGMPGKEQIEQGKARLSSIFRLFGVERNHSPTLVLGNVLSQFLTISLLSDSSGNPANPPVLKNMSYSAPFLPATYFRSLIDSNEYADLRDAFGLDNSPPSYVKYIKEFAPKVSQRPYNAGIAFIHNQTDPDAILSFPDSDQLAKMMKNSDNDWKHKIPGVFADVFPGVNDLKDMKKFFAAFSGDSRSSYLIENSASANLMEDLKKECLISRNRLALNGWIKTRNGFKLSEKVEFVSSGGIIAENGDIVIENSIIPSDHREKGLIYFIALNGNIIFRNAPEDTIQAAFIAFSDSPDKGRVIFEKPPKEIRGALAMKKLVKNGSEAETFKGTKLVYFSPLAAKPGTESSMSEDDELLTWNFSLAPQELK